MNKVLLISFAISILGFIPLMGIPGAFVLPLSKPLVYLMHGPMAYEAATQSLGDKTWPLMLMLSVLWPISIPVAFFISQKLAGDLPFLSIGFFIPFILFVQLGTTIISTITVKTNLSVRRLNDTEVLAQALKNGKLSLVKKHWNASSNDSYPFGDPLYLALENNQTDVVRYLLEQGVNPSSYLGEVEGFNPGTTPLHTAVKKGMTGIVKELLEKGANPDATTNHGRTPLHDLGEMDGKMLPVLELMKTYGANFAAVDQDGNTPLIAIVSINAPLLKHRPQLARKLIEYGCPRDYKNEKGETALSIIVKNQPYEKELIEVVR